MILKRPDLFHSKRIELPGSKSESNRALILQALSDEPIQIHNLSSADDTRIIHNALQGDSTLIDCEHSGAALRFLCAYFSILNNREIILTGSQRLKERPLKILVDALKELGAHIEYLEKQGYAPIKIKGKELVSHSYLNIQGDVSSQFISALLMIAPKIKNGLQLHIQNELISAPYLHMTMNMMHQAKIHIIKNDNSIIVPEQEYEGVQFQIESDWSAASYWYAMVSMGLPEVTLLGLYPNSIQGDAIISSWMSDWNVETEFIEGGVKLTHNNHFKPKSHYHFVDCPDLAQTLIVLSALKKHNLSFSGIESLRLKETDRVMALQTELRKFGFDLFEVEAGHWTLDTGRWTSDAGHWTLDANGEVKISTYNDHRMAMAYSMTCMILKEVHIENEQVVSKSYPNFWKDLQSIGFRVGS